MKYLFLPLLLCLILYSCSNKNQLVYLNDSTISSYDKIDFKNFKNSIESGDILKIDVYTTIPELAIPYNKYTGLSSSDFDLVKLNGYLVDEFKMINYPVLGKVSVDTLSVSQLEMRISKLLLNGGHLTNPIVKVSRINSKFTILGEVRAPGTFSYFDEKLNIFQAIGYSGDLTIQGKRKDITLIREEKGIRKVFKVSLSHLDLLEKPYYYIKNNDVIIIEPNFSKVKSAGFIGSPSSIASISSLLLSITLLIINN